MGLKHLVLIPQGGLCNRIRAIASARRLGAMTGAKCTIVWDWADFYALFASDSSIDILPPEKTPTGYHSLYLKRPGEGGSPVNWRVPISTHELIIVSSRFVFNAVEESALVDNHELRKWLPRPSELVLEKVRHFKQAQFKAPTIGMHIRRTDHQPAIKAAPDRLFLQAGHRLVGLGAQIFLATDNSETERMWRAEFGKNVLIYQKNEALDIRWPRTDFSARETIDDLVDLHLLGSCQYVIGSPYSSFSHLAMLYCGSPRSVVLYDGQAAAAH